MIRINRLYATILGAILALIIYLAGQLLFFINTARARGEVCDVVDGGNRRRYQYYYVCFDTPDGYEVKFNAGSNLDYTIGDTVDVVYKKNNGRHARISSPVSLWLVPGLYYLFPFAIIMVTIVGIYYKYKYVAIIKRPFRMYLVPHDIPDY